MTGFRVCLCLLALSMVVVPVQAQALFQKTLVSTVKNVHVGSWTTTGKNLTPDCRIPWSVRLVRLHGGKQEGVDLIVIDNGQLKMTLIPTRGLGIQSVQLGDLRLGWDSPVKEVVHPKFINLQARGGLGWLEGFTEWLCRCGMENNGQPGTDRFVYNVGDEATMELTLHGKVANIPAQDVKLILRGTKTKPRIVIQGRVDEKMLFGPKLELHTEISTQVGSSRFRIDDKVVNAGAQAQEFQMLYHLNFGRPLLQEGARFVAPLAKVAPFNKRAGEDLHRFSSYDAPTPGYVEQVYVMEPLANQAGKTTILLRNRKGDRGASMTYRVKELPYLTLWKNTGAITDGYVTGIEPGTNYPNTRRIERKFGRVPKLAAGKGHRMTIDVGLHVTAAEVSGVVRGIEAIQGKRKTKVVRMPEK
ncbi:MAG: aldose 1-epimerase family protein [Gemmataceae bacterium]